MAMLSESGESANVREIIPSDDSGAESFISHAWSQYSNGQA
ncbi:Uncharacterised protein [Pasteurella multocida]|nr:Uncharacterised protein [Pasteurella multocida]